MTDNFESGNSTTSCDENSDNWYSNPTADILKEGLLNTLKPVLDQIYGNVTDARESQGKLNGTLNALHDNLKNIKTLDNICDEKFYDYYLNKITLANQKLHVLNSSLQSINKRLKDIEEYLKHKNET